MSLRPLSRSVCFAVVWLAGAAGAADDDAAGRRAGDACEAAVASAVRETHGVLFSDRGGAAATAPAAQPDLARLSPEACEAATAAALKTKHPRVDRITFGSDSRELMAVPEARTALEGRGALARAPGMNAVPFSYRCEFDNRSGRVVAVRTSD